MAWEWHDSSDFYLSYVREGRAGAVLLLVFRIAMLLFFLIGILLQIAAPPSVATDLEPSFLNFFTNWTWIGFAVYSLLAVLVSARGVRRCAAAATTLGVAGIEPLDALDKSLAVVFAAIPASALFLTVFYWLVLYDAETTTVCLPSLLPDFPPLSC